MVITFIAVEPERPAERVEITVDLGTARHIEVTAEYIRFLRAIGYVIDYEVEQRILDAF